MINTAASRALAAAALAGLTASGGAAQAQRFAQELRHSMAPCQGDGPAVLLTVTGIRNNTGDVRTQLYRANAEEWLARNRHLTRIDLPARQGTMTICMPVPEAGEYAIAIRHDANANEDTDITSDGGAMSNNPPLNIFNLGRPSISRTKFAIGKQVLPMTVRMRYL